MSAKKFSEITYVIKSALFADAVREPGTENPENSGSIPVCVSYLSGRSARNSVGGCNPVSCSSVSPETAGKVSADRHPDCWILKGKVPGRRNEAPVGPDSDRLFRKPVMMQRNRRRHLKHDELLKPDFHKTSNLPVLSVQDRTGIGEEPVFVHEKEMGHTNSNGSSVRTDSRGHHVRYQLHRRDGFGQILLKTKICR